MEFSNLGGKVLLEVVVRKGLAGRLFLVLPLILLIFVQPQAISQDSPIDFTFDPLALSGAFIELPLSAVDVVGDKNFGFQTAGLADFNEDGLLDIAVVSGDFVELSLGDGQGKFSFLMDSLNLFVESSQSNAQGVNTLEPPLDQTIFPIDSVVGDFNGDKHVDVAVFVAILGASSETISRTLYILLGDGAGGLEKLDATITPLVPSEFESSFPALLAGDFDADGQADLLLLQSSETGQVLAQKFPRIVDATFETQSLETLTLPENVEGPILALEVGDFNNDENPDLFVELPLHVQLLLGDGSFGFSSFPMFEKTENQTINEMLLVNMTEDKLVDAVAFIDDEIRVYIQAESGFSLLGKIEMQDDIVRIRAGDFNADGFQDLLLFAFEKRLLIALGNGTGQFSFSDPIEYFSFGAPSEVFVADLTGNGRDDFITGSGNDFQVFLNQLQPQGITRLFLSDGSLLGLADLDGDGIRELISRTTNGLEVLWNNGNGSFTRRTLANFPPEIFPSSLGEVRLKGSSSSVLLHRGKAVDIDHDGKEEFIVLGQQNTDPIVGFFLVIDVDQRFEHAADLKTYRFLADGTPNLGIGDLNGDGELDVVTSGAQTIITWLGDGAGQFDTSLIDRFEIEAGELGFLEVGNFKADDQAEIVALVNTDEALEINLYEINANQLIKLDTISKLSGSIPFTLKTAQLNDDQLDDLVLSTWALSLQVVIQNDEEKLALTLDNTTVLTLLSDGQSFETITYPIGDWDERATPAALTGLTVGDFNGDGVQDVGIGAGVDFDTSILNGTPSLGTYTFGNQIECTNGPLFAEDLDGNGRTELITSSADLFSHVCILWNRGRE